MNLLKSVSHPESAVNLIVVMGISGTGKSTLSERLAIRYGYTYLDADNFHSQESRNLMASGIPLTDKERAPWVASICAELRERLHNKSPVVLAFSGLKKHHRDLLREVGLRTLFLFLHGEKTVVHHRMTMRKDHYMSASMLDSQLASLENPETEADVFPIDIGADLSSVTEQAISIIEAQLPPLGSLLPGYTASAT